MRITLNLALLPSRRERYALSWAVPLAVMSVVGLFFIVRFGIANIREYRHVQDDIARMQEQNRKLAREEKDLRKAVEAPEYRAVSVQAHYLNTLIEEKKSSVADIVTKISRLIPAEVRLSSMSLKQSKGAVVSFSVEGRNEGALEEFLTALEDSPDFQDVSVSNEGFKADSETESSVTITCTARYVGSLVP
jgi:Fimbrial assembly protein (PilN)